MKRYLYIVIPVMIIEFIVFKHFYPFADFFTDSYSYIQAAADKDSIGYRPIGYSIFLRLVHLVSASDTFLVGIQYLLVQSSVLALFYYLHRWCGLSARIQWILVGFILLNPAIPYLCNYVSSDALFLALSLLWLIVLMEMILRPSWWWVWIQLILLVFIFNTRYVALYYPAVASIAFLLARDRQASGLAPGGLLFRLTGLALSIVVIFAGTAAIKGVTRRETGANIFSAFSGWQIANNALNMYPYIPVDTAGMPSPETRELAGYVRAYFDTAGPALSQREPFATTAYMWERNLPLHRYMQARQKKERQNYFITWNRVGPAFTEYGYHLVRQHPIAYSRYYMWPSAKGFFLSPLDVFAVYNEGQPTVDAVARDWFHYPSLKPEVYSARLQAALLAPLPLFVLLLNAAFVVTAILYLPWRRIRDRHPVFTSCFQLVAAYLLANACFCIIASPSVFRYQVLPMILLFIFTVCGLGVWGRRPA
jgi:hypothetical protein